VSEYQYHEWQTVDRVLTPEEQAAVNNLSSHIEVSSSRTVVTYHWSDFRHDPKQVLLKYFDAYFYLANWGSLRLIFRFPKGLLDEADILPYCIDEFITFDTIGKYQVLDLDFSPEEGEGWMEAEAGLSHFIRLRADLLEGDFRLLYLAWLKAMTFYGDSYDDEEYEEDDPDLADYNCEPPVPPGLKKLSPPLQTFIQVFEIDPFLVQAAAEASPDLKEALAVDYRELIGRLPRVEGDDFLAHLKHIAEMKALAAREAQIWQQVETLLDTRRKIASVYDEATVLLEKLKLLTEFQDTRDVFRERLHRLAQNYAKRPSLIDRWKKRGWVQSTGDLEHARHLYKPQGLYVLLVSGFDENWQVALLLCPRAKSGVP
jgi:hypothetical protein